MRILYLEPSGLVTGGAIALLRLITALDRRSFSPLVVLGSEGPLVAEFRRIPGCRVLCRPLPAALAAATRNNILRRALTNSSAILGYAAGVRRIAIRWRPDVIHSNGLKTHCVAALARSSGARVIWHMRDYISPPYMPAAPAAFVRLLARWMPDALVCNSEVTRASIVNGAYGKVAADAIRLIPDGIASPVHQPHALPTSHRQRTRRVVLLGRIAEWKGQHVFVDAARHLSRTHPDVLFLIAGAATTAADAEYEADLRRRIDAEGLGERVVLCGVVRNPRELLKRADILVHCSTTPEPFGQVIIEAMAAAVPVVASRLGAPAAMIEDGVSGRLFTPGDAGALARTLTETLNDADARGRLAAAGLARVRERYGIERTAQGFAALYQEACLRRAERAA